MTDLQSLIRLQTWLSPAFPTGAYSYSSGLEAAISENMIIEKTDLCDWLTDVLHEGAGWNDAVLLAESWRHYSDQHALEKLVELGVALNFSKTRQLETIAQGNAFLEAAKSWHDLEILPSNSPLPICVGVIAGHHEIDLKQTLAAYLHSYISNQVQAALRLMKLGQRGGLEILALLEAEIISVAERASQSTLGNLASNTFLADIATMKHEILASRIFRS